MKVGVPGVEAGSSAAASTAITPELHGNAANHKALYTYRSLKELFEAAGFRVTLYEYFDEAGQFPLRRMEPAARYYLALQAVQPPEQDRPADQRLSRHPGRLPELLVDHPGRG